VKDDEEEEGCIGGTNAKTMADSCLERVLHERRSLDCSLVNEVSREESVLVDRKEAWANRVRIPERWGIARLEGDVECLFRWLAWVDLWVAQHFAWGWEQQQQCRVVVVVVVEV